MESVYGNYRTNKFTDYYGNATSFLADYKDNGIPTTISDTTATTLYYLLYARYGNSHICSSDPNQFKYKLFSIIFQYGPTWEKRLDIQEKLRNLTEDEIIKGSKAIYNQASNPAVAPSDTSLEELPYINNQNTTNYKKSKMDAYAMLMSLLDTDVTEAFIKKFAVLFLKIVEPQEPLWYETEVNNDI